MISSRRLAREWALKILYQKDVGKVPVQEALDTAMERLRMEFVLRGSRTASGSSTEQICLDLVMSDLSDLLEGLSRSMERALITVATRLVQDLVYWQEQRIDRLFREPASALPSNSSRRLLMRHVAEAFGLTEGEVAILPGLNPPRIARPQPETAIFEGIDLTTLTTAGGETGNGGARLLRFAHQVREQLPIRLDEAFRKEGIRFVRELVQDRPADSELSAYLKAKREAFLQAQKERYHKVGEIVARQMGDWLRTAEFTVRLVHGVTNYQQDIDASIAQLSAGWNMDRQVAVDRNILRIGGFEIMYVAGVPVAASIDEAVELAKKYSTAESSKFVNGVLGTLARQYTDPNSSSKNDSKDDRFAASTEEYDVDDSILDMPDGIEDIEDIEDPENFQNSN